MYVAPVSRIQFAPPARGPFAAHWRGDLGLLAATALPVTLLIVLWGLFLTAFRSVDWVWHHRSGPFASLVLIVLLLACATWGAVGVGRSARKADDRGHGIFTVYCGPSIVMAVVMATVGQFGLETRLWLTSLWSLTRGHDAALEISQDRSRAMLSVQGSFVFGATRRVRDALDAAPWVKTVRFDSLGGFAVEGLAMGKLLAGRELDTFVDGRCASACVTAFAGGDQRYLGPEGRLGLHVAGKGMLKGGRDVDREHADFLLSRGVSQSLVDAELATPNDDIYVPSKPALLASALVTRVKELE